MKKLGEPAFVVMFFVVFAMSASAAEFSKHDFLQKIETKVDITSAYTHYKICNPTQAQYHISSNGDFNIQFNTIKGVLKSYKFSILQDVPYYVDEYRESCSTETQLVNTTDGKTEYKDITDCRQVKSGSYIETKKEWVDFNPVGKSFASSECYDIKIEGTYAPAYRDNKIVIDNVISYAGYSFDEYDWWNTTWEYKKPIEINASSNDYEYQIYFNVTYEWGMNANFTDLRFLNEEENTSLPYGIEQWQNGSWAAGWFRIDSIDAQNSTQAYIYYGNDQATNISNYTDIFDLYESFEDSNWNNPSWVINHPDNTDATFETINGDIWAKFFRIGVKSPFKATVKSEKINTTNGFILNYQQKISSGDAAGGGLCLAINQSGFSDYATCIYDIAINDDSYDWKSGFINFNSSWEGAGRHQTYGVFASENTSNSVAWVMPDKIKNVVYNVQLTKDQNHNFTITINGTQQISLITGTDNPYDHSIQSISLLGVSASGDGNGVYYNNIKIRKYMYPEPTIAFGQEENQSTGPANETEGRAAIETGIANALGSGYSVYTDQKVYGRHTNTSQVKGTFDEFVVYNSKRWAFNYDNETSAGFTNMFNLTPTLYVLEVYDKSSSQITLAVENMINLTKE